MLRNFVLFTLFTIFTCALHPHALSGPPEFQPSADGQAELEEILKKCAEYCEKLDNSALFFVCQEWISEQISVGPVRRSGLGDLARFSYIYDYQLIKKGSTKKEKRTLIEENGEKKNEENVLLKNKLFFHENLVFGPQTLLHAARQPFSDFKIEKEEKFKGKKAIIIKATPKPFDLSYYPYGKVWIDAEDFNILKIEWDQKSLKSYAETLNRLKKNKLEPRWKIVTEYGFEKNGLRFPSKHSVKEEYVGFGRRFIVSKTTVEYKDYKFFIVETEVKY